MKRMILKNIVVLIVCLFSMVVLTCFAWAGSGDKPRYQVSKPHTYENLSIYVIEGEDTLKGKKMVTLDEALKAKTAVVHETGNVNTLSIENLSENTYVFIQSGDIVKGGKQDRTMQNDMVIKPRSGKVPLNAFCVEAGRWTKRKGESVSSFSGSSDRLYSKKLKLAAKSKKSQTEVWKEVAEAQDELSKKVGGNVKSGMSESSLQLTLENEDLKKEVSIYMDALTPVLTQYDDALGYAFTINGEFNSCDIFGSKELFKQLWPKLLKASATEAVAAREKGKTYTVATVKDVELNMADAFQGKEKESMEKKDIRWQTKESDTNMLYDTYDSEGSTGVEIHRNIIRK